ncbi:MAG: bifunctional diguanylate cyclase/phosphodiesterase, partial [Deltaproteobacteria bacterium]|nr:bifunctional diguanylate cyclase/phosphodiesterase [Deltaproteobacteria bacterium]
LEVSDFLEKPLSLACVKDSIARGIKRRMLKREAIEKKSDHKLLSDSLTGLPDRSLFMNRLQKAITGITPDNDSSFAILLIDVDQFKVVNDAYGHTVGDKVLSELAHRFKTCIRPTDTIARMNGDVFAVLIEEPERDNKVIEMAESCQRAAGRAFLMDGNRLPISISIGIVMKTVFYESPDEVLRDAEMAVAHCKKQGRGLVKVFNTEMLEQAVESLQLENDLRLGIPNQEFILHYQPIMGIADPQPAGLEALIRWNHPEHGLIHPDKFVARAEETGLMTEIGNWVLSEGGRQIREWQETIPGFEELTLNVSIYANQFWQPGFADVVQDIIDAHRLNPGSLKLGLTEGMLMKDAKRSKKILQAIKKIGIKLVLDNFGSGYSSFSSLQLFPFDDLKICRSFIQKLAVDSESCEIVKTMVNLAKKLGLNVIAAGVENEGDLTHVKSLNFNMVQGFPFAKPVDKYAVIKLLNQGIGN